MGRATGFGSGSRAAAAIGSSTLGWTSTMGRATGFGNGSRPTAAIGSSAPGWTSTMGRATGFGSGSRTAALPSTVISAAKERWFTSLSVLFVLALVPADCVKG